MVGGLGDFLLKQEEVGEQEREDLVMWLHQVSAINIHMHLPNPYHSSLKTWSHACRAICLLFSRRRKQLFAGVRRGGSSD